MLTAGREDPDQAGSRQTGEDVAIVLSTPAVHDWKSGPAVNA